MNYLSITLTAFLLLSIGCGNSNKMVELKFYEFYPDAYIGSRTIQKEEYKNLTSVLVYYGFNFCYKEGKIYINEKDTFDKEYLANVCQKSKDSIWMKAHLK